MHYPITQYVYVILLINNYSMISSLRIINSFFRATGNDIYNVECELCGKKKGQKYNFRIYLLHKLSLYPINDITITQTLA